MANCNHKNKQRTFLGKQEVVSCVLEKNHEGNHRGFSKVLGKAVSNPSLYDGWEHVEKDGITYLVDEELINWDDSCGEELK